MVAEYSLVPPRAPDPALTIRVDGALNLSVVMPPSYITIGEGDDAEHCAIVSYKPLRVRRGDVIYELKTVGKEATPSSSR